MKTNEAIAKRVQDLCAEKGITINALSILAGMPRSTIYSMMYECNKNPKIMSIKRICDAFGITLCDFFDTDYFRDLEPEFD